jgi:NAD(P)H dehydrogenase (quinone)
MILVTGATGGLGKTTIDKLVELVNPSKITAMIRDESKGRDLIDKGVHLVIGDYMNYDSLVSAFKGVDTVILISAPTFTDRDTQQRNAIKAAIASGVKRVIYTGIQRKEGSNYVIPMVTESDLDTEKALKESGLSYTIVLNNIYADVLDFLLGENPAQLSAVEFPAGNGRISFTTRKDLGAGLALLAVQEGHENKTYTFTNSESLTFSQIADIISELSGKTIKYEDVDRAAYVSKLAGNGLPEVVADFAAEWADAVREGELGEVYPILTELLGKYPTSLKDYLKEAFFKG